MMVNKVDSQRVTSQILRKKEIAEKNDGRLSFSGLKRFEANGELGTGMKNQNAGSKKREAKAEEKISKK